ncbi:hypothetical protein HDU76_013641 [Blyttiomyces sp. JEL0837]|nr:hypothetical protein HDU76_013641 [Blyttiomyces sp. JEL0837]
MTGDSNKFLIAFCYGSTHSFDKVDVIAFAIKLEQQIGSLSTKSTQPCTRSYAICFVQVPTASVKAEKNRCARNCFECPVCDNTLNVVSVVEPSASGVNSPIQAPSTPTTSRSTPPGSPMGSTASLTATSGVHYLSCGVCRWNSLEIDLKFERPTGLAMQLQKSEEERPDVKEFDNLRDYYERMIRANNPSGSVSSLFRSTGSLNLPPSLLASVPVLASLTSLASRQSSLSMLSGKNEPLAPYEPEVRPSAAADEDELANIRNLKIEEASSLKQRLNQLDDQPRSISSLRPQRIQLRTKRSKRCRECEHILIKPEQKAQIPRFKIQLMAIKYMPTITIAHPFPNMPLLANNAVRIHLRFTNPLDQDVSVSLKTIPSDNSDDVDSGPRINCNVLFPAPSFTIPAFNELGDYDDISNQPSPLGIVEKKNNFTIVAVEVIPVKTNPKSSRVEFPLNVQFTRTISTSILPSASDGAASATDTTPNEESHTLSFWVLIGIGEIKD